MTGSSHVTPTPRADGGRSLRLNQVTVPPRDLARSIAFYSGLGLKLIYLFHAGVNRKDPPWRLDDAVE